MSITSIRFIVFALGILTVYLFSDKLFRKYLLILAGILFYASFNYYGVIYLGVVFVISYWAGKHLTKNRLYTMIFLTLSGLVFFKLNSMVEIIGISFISFKVISYLTDVYNHKIAETSFTDYLVYLSFFPVLTAGPIVRFNDFKVQDEIDYSLIKEGFVLFMLGIFEKLVVVLRIEEIINQIYLTDNLSSSYYLLAVVLYSLQIYFDFDAYSNMAIGLSRMFGYKLKPNFKTPYFAENLSEFWKRWHISLSSWFKDYVYIPLGGNKKGKLRQYLNILIVSVLSGLWHGLNPSCLLWGIIHGVYQIINHQAAFKGFLGRLTTFILVTFSWIFFRNNLNEALRIINEVLKFNFQRIDSALLGINNADFNVTMVLVSGMVILDYFRYRFDVLKWFNNRNMLFRWSVYLLLIFCFLLFGKYGIDYQASDFIYQTF